MAAGDRDTDDLDKLLAEVQRTIRENDRFIRNLKDEADEGDEGDEGDDAGSEEVSGQDPDGEGGGFEEL